MSRNTQNKKISQSVSDAEERMRIMFDATPLCCNFWDEQYNNIDCNQEAVNLFELSSKEEYLARFPDLSPQYQPDGRLSSEKAVEKIKEAFETGRARFEWMHQKLNGESVPAEIILVRVEYGKHYVVLGYTRDLRELKASMSEAYDAEERMRIMFDATPLCCNLWDEQYNNIDCNQEAVNLFELSSKEEYLARFFDLSPQYQPDGRLSSEKAAEKIKEAFETGRSQFEWMHQKLNGEPIPAEITLVRVQYGKDYVVAGYTRDLRELKASMSEAHEAEERMRIMFDATPLCCNLWDEQYNNIGCNQEAVNLFELSSKEEYLARFFDLSPQYQPDGRLSSEKAAEKIKEAFETDRARFEWMHQKLNGEPIPAEITLVRVQYGKDYVVAGYTRDLRELKETVILLNQLEQLAFTDTVTNIHNRRHFMDNARNIFSYANDRPLSIMLMDLDWFKNVNDTYGHIAGDEVLKSVSQEVKNALRSSDLLARYGGEEFIILVLDSNKELIMKLAERIRNRIANARFTFQEHTIRITVSIGIAMKSDSSVTLEKLIQTADRALYKAKQAGRNQVEISSEI